VLEGRTALVIAHRLSTIRNADKIIALEKGRIIEVGDHQELMRRGGLYSQLYRRQLELAAAGDVSIE
jgi:ATP-binding cassette subfamily B protein